MSIPTQNTSPRVIERYVQQMVGPALGEYKALRSCAPSCFFMVAKAEGYLLDGPGSDLVSFVGSLNWEDDFVESRGWVRPWLCRTLRERYGLSLVSWRIDGNHDGSDETIEKMQAAGYIQTEREIAFYRDHVIGRDIEEIVADGHPMIVGVLPEFGHNRREHAMVLSHWINDGVEVIDPDERNPYHTYPASYVRGHLNPSGGGCTIILPASN